MATRGPGAVRRNGGDRLCCMTLFVGVRFEHDHRGGCLDSGRRRCAGTCLGDGAAWRGRAANGAAIESPFLIAQPGEAALGQTTPNCGPRATGQAETNNGSLRELAHRPDRVAHAPRIDVQELLELRGVLVGHRGQHLGERRPVANSTFKRPCHPPRAAACSRRASRRCAAGHHRPWIGWPTRPDSAR